MNTKSAVIIVLAILVHQNRLTLPKANEYIKKLDNNLSYVDGLTIEKVLAIIL